MIKVPKPEILFCTVLPIGYNFEFSTENYCLDLIVKVLPDKLTQRIIFFRDRSSATFRQVTRCRPKFHGTNETSKSPKCNFANCLFRTHMSWYDSMSQKKNNHVRS